MKVFISWSGERSKLLASSLKDWLQPILQSVEVWMSEVDIDAGDRWGQEVARELSACNFGIICVTPENVNAPWVLFEAGALAKSLDGSKVIPLLFDLELRQISGPLAQFQAKKFDKSGLSEVATSINKELQQPVTETSLRALLEAMWPGLKQKIEEVPKQPHTSKSPRTQAEILEDLVIGIRGLDSRLRDTETGFLSPNARNRRKRSPHAAEMILDITSDLMNDDPIGILVLSGLIREDFPWLSEILMEFHRQLRTSQVQSAHRSLAQIIKLVEILTRGPISDDLGVPKESLFLIHRLPRFLESQFERAVNRHKERPSLRHARPRTSDAATAPPPSQASDE